MPPRAKGARLWLRPERRSASGKLISRASWLILDAGRHIATGCAAGEIAAAEARLGEYIATKYRPRRKERDIEEIKIADVLTIYLEDRGEAIARRHELVERLGRLNEFRGAKTLSEISGETCGAYVRERGTMSGARRELGDLSAAIGHHRKQGFHRGSVQISLPPKGLPRDRWLTRSEAARLLWTCWSTRETKRAIPTVRFPLRHIARFILIGLYTGTRAAAIAAAAPARGEGRAYVDLPRGMFYRLAIGKRATNKRQPPIPLPQQLLAHMRRWARIGVADDYFVTWHGKPVRSVKKGFARAVALAGLADVTPHTLRHTAATWLMQNGTEIWEAAGFLGMSPEILARVYGHHHPDHLRDAARKIGGKGKSRDALVVSLEEARVRRLENHKTS
jgi:integrase